MRIDFKRIEIHNFMAYADEVFDFDKHIGLNLICGKNNDIPGSKNGCAKSQLFGALCYALYGQTPNKVKNENIRNRYVKAKDVRVVIWLDVEDKKFKIASGFNKYGAPYYTAAELVDDKEIDLTKSTIAETREFVAKEVLHCDMSIFLRTVLLSSDITYNFFVLRKSEKKDFIEKLFDISIFGEMYNKIHRDVLDFDKQILAAQNKIMVVNRYLDDYKTQIEDYDKKHAKNIEDFQATLAQLKAKYENLKGTQISQNEAEVAKYETLANKLDAGIVKIRNQLHSSEYEVQRLDFSMHKAKATRDLKQKQIDKHDELLSKLCDHCLPLIREYYSISSLENDILEQNKLLEEYESKKAAAQEEYDSFDKKLKQLEKKKEQVEQKIDALTSEYNKAHSELLLLESKVENAELQLEKEKTQTNPYTALFDKTKIELDDENRKYTSLTNQYKYLKYAESIVSQDTLRKFIIKDLIQLLNNKIKIYLSKLGANYDCVFDEDMNYVFNTPGGKCEYDSFSSGERMRLNIAASFAFRDFMATRSNLMSNILVLDEYIDSNIDALAIDGIIGILRDFILLYNQNVYLISHRKETIDNSIFDNIIQMVKTNNISKITYLESK